MKLAMMFVLGVSMLLCQAPEAEAQEKLPRIGVRKWTITSPDMRTSGSVAYARKGDLFFVGTSEGYILVVDTQQGRITDTINLRDYPALWDKLGTIKLDVVFWIGTTDDGSLVAFGLLNPNIGTIMVEYPSKRLLDSTEMGLGYNTSTWPEGLVLSPRGRFLAIDPGIVIDRQTGKTWKTSPRYEYGATSFDEAETMVAYRGDSMINGVNYRGFVFIQPLADTGIAPIRTNLYGRPTLSADGTKLMTSGPAYSTYGPSKALDSKVVVMDLATRVILWDMSSLGESDFRNCAWSPDVTTYFGSRSSSWLPESDRYRL